MSIRTIVEINHDNLNDLQEHPERLREIVECLYKNNATKLAELRYLTNGVRFLGQRHHSDEMTITVR